MKQKKKLIAMEHIKDMDLYELLQLWYEARAGNDEKIGIIPDLYSCIKQIEAFINEIIKDQTVPDDDN